MSKNIDELLDEIFGSDEKLKSEIRKAREQNEQRDFSVELPISDLHMGQMPFNHSGAGTGKNASVVAFAHMMDAPLVKIHSHTFDGANETLNDEENKRPKISKEPKKTFEYEGKEYELRIGSYPMAPLAMFVGIQEKGNQDPSNERILSVCLGNYQSEGSFVQPFCTFIDINNSPDAIDILEQSGLAEPYVKWGEIVEMQSGFVLYPVYQFNQNMLQELDPQGCEKYMEDWGKQCQIEQDKMNEEMFGPDWRKMFGEEECL